MKRFHVNIPAPFLELRCQPLLIFLVVWRTDVVRPCRKQFGVVPDIVRRNRGAEFFLPLPFCARIIPREACQNGRRVLLRQKRPCHQSQSRECNETPPHIRRPHKISLTAMTRLYARPQHLRSGRLSSPFAYAEPQAILACSPGRPRRRVSASIKEAAGPRSFWHSPRKFCSFEVDDQPPSALRSHRVEFIARTLARYGFEGADSCKRLQYASSSPWPS